MPSLEHCVLPRGQTYKMCDHCVLQDWKLSDWPGDAHLMVSHGEECECESRGKIYSSAFDSVQRGANHEVIPPLPSVKKG